MEKGRYDKNASHPHLMTLSVRSIRFRPNKASPTNGHTQYGHIPKRPNREINIQWENNEGIITQPR
jgi:hypothetical protein